VQEIFIDEEFNSLLPELDEKTHASLEENLLNNGCVYPILLWGNIIIDGHIRYQICKKHDIPFSTVNKDFASRDDALVWIITTQILRRNLTPLQLSYYRGTHYQAVKRIQGDYKRLPDENKNRQNDGFTGSTARRLAEQYSVSPRTIERDAKVAEAISAIGKSSPDAKRNILSGAASITRKQLQVLSDGSDADIELVASSIEEGTFERKGTAKTGSVKEEVFDDQIKTGENPFNSAISRLTDEFCSSLRSLTKDSDAPELKRTLKAYIDALEDLHGQM